MGVICGLDDGYDYGYTFKKGEVTNHSFIVTDNLVLPSIKSEGRLHNKIDYLEWNVIFSSSIFWFRLDKDTLVLTTQNSDMDIDFKHNCKIYDATNWEIKFAELGKKYQDEYDTYLIFEDAYNKTLELQSK